MTILATDITFTFSGGAGNSDPDASLGGESSLVPITSQQLFADIEPEESNDGIVDYRCFYLHNENLDDSLYNSKLSISDTVPGDVAVELGFFSSNERQTVTVLSANLITSGSFELTYSDVNGNHDFVVAWNNDDATWAGNLQTAIRTVPGLEDVTINVNSSSSNITFEIDFIETAGLRFHDLLVVKTNSLAPATSVGISRTVAGGPINSEADIIDFPTTVPNGIEFIDVSEIFEIGELKPLDSVPIWVRRTVPAGTEAQESDGFTFRLSGNPVA